MNWRKPLLRAILNVKDTLQGSCCGTTRFYDEILALEFSSRGTIEECQTRRLEELLVHCHRHVPYYRRVLEDTGVVRDGKVHLDSFKDAPFLSKDTIRENREDLVSDECGKRRVYHNTSGGSTGEPIDLLQDNVYKSMNWATVLFYNHALGKELGDKEVKLWGSERDILKGSLGTKARIENFLYNRLLLNSFRMTPVALREFVKKIDRFRPKSIWAYVDSILELARFVENEGLKVCPVPATICTAGTLTPEIREYVEETLGTTVYNQYGSREVGPIAAECGAEKRLHLFEWSQYVEVVDSDGKPAAPGETGEVVITLFSNYSMPLVRYRIGDTAVQTDRVCSCGRNTRLLAAVTGRLTDYFVRRDGTLVHGEYFTHVFYNRGWARRFQVVQEEYDRVVNNVEVKEPPGEVEEKEVERAIRAAMGSSCQVEFRYVDRIEPSASGKYLYTLSRVERDSNAGGRASS
jgi:phenylacetate-coenzyme A ligase PaaK-like adenylate-forming protein